MAQYVWTEEKTLRLIELYREQEELWNLLEHRYHRYLKDAKYDGWCQIADAMEATIDVCKAKMTSISASFRGEKARVKRSIGTGRGKYNNIFVHTLVYIQNETFFRVRMYFFISFQQFM